MSKFQNNIKYLFEKYGNYNYIGEEISQLSHSIQTAMLAEKYTYDKEVIIAAFLHDIGHLIGLENNNSKMSNYGIDNHEKIDLHPFGNCLCRSRDRLRRRNSNPRTPAG